MADEQGDGRDRGGDVGGGADGGVHVDVVAVILRAIAGDEGATTWIRAHADTSADPTVVALAALLDPGIERIARAGTLATTSRERQVVAIADARLRGEHDRVDALARDHLVDHPDSILVAWIASGSAAARDVLP